MKDIKQQADELINHFSQHIELFDEEYILCAIASTENTINLLREIRDEMYNDTGYTPIYLNKSINQQTELLNELKSRL